MNIVHFLIILHLCLDVGAISIFYLTLGHLKDVESFVGKKIDQLSPPFPHLAQGAVNNVGYELLIFPATHLKIDSIGAVKGTVSVPFTSRLLTLIEPALLPASLSTSNRSIRKTILSL